ncbi:MAG TPA: outer membrane lipoprotein carrier protein LolA [Vicinamibacterales bacterium]|jgi:outer membrane lipoprotein carrier protein|nr:outer membrane lipoprotein carrier protein LolA [Vicinamibacterales bacterium]
MPILRAAAVLLTILGLSAAAPRAQSGSSPADVAARIQAHYASVRDFEADFTLAQSSGLTPQSAVDKGHVLVKKPGRMRWTFQTGNRSEVISDGVEIYAYFPKDKYVQVTPFPKPGDRSTALLYLTGRGDLTRDFVASQPDDPSPAGDVRVTLKPKTPQSDFVSLTLGVDARSLIWRTLVIVDDQGGVRTFTFTNLRENRGIPDRAFEFAIPRGVDIRR